jgi:[ribosomal protein S18]-alanine N-acetyltransferase
MIAFITRLFVRGEPVLSETTVRDAHDLAELHAASFRRGWTDGEFTRLLIEPNVIAHRIAVGRKLYGFIMSRHTGDEAEILSIAVATAQRGRGLGRRLLDLHIRRLAGLGIQAVLLEVDEDNAAARRLYARAGFREIGRRAGYYQRPGTTAGHALVLRRDLA